MASASSPPTSPNAFKMQLAGESLLEVLEPVLKSGTDTHLRVQLGQHTTDMYIHDSRIVHATSSCFAGKEAAYNLIAWRNGELTISKDIEAPEQTVDIAWLDFLRFYEEEIEKIALAFMPNHIGFNSESFSGCTLRAVFNPLNNPSPTVLLSSSIIHVYCTCNPATILRSIISAVVNPIEL